MSMKFYEILHLRMKRDAFAPYKRSVWEIARRPREIRLRWNSSFSEDAWRVTLQIIWGTFLKVEYPVTLQITVLNPVTFDFWALACWLCLDSNATDFESASGRNGQIERAPTVRAFMGASPVFDQLPVASASYAVHTAPLASWASSYRSHSILHRVFYSDSGLPAKWEWNQLLAWRILSRNSISCMVGIIGQTLIYVVRAAHLYEPVNQTAHEHFNPDWLNFQTEERQAFDRNWKAARVFVDSDSIKYAMR